MRCQDIKNVQINITFLSLEKMIKIMVNFIISNIYKVDTYISFLNAKDNPIS